MSAEDQDAAAWDFVDLINENCAALFEISYNVNVVHDLLAHIDRCAVVVECFFNGDYGSVYACAVATRRRQKYFFRALLSHLFGILDFNHSPILSGQVRGCS